MQMNRFLEHRLRADERPKTIYEYYVTGSGEFPFDMLRHDSCWPATGMDVVLIDRHERQLRSIKIRSYRKPTIDRWSSFTWSVGTENLNRGEER